MVRASVLKKLCAIQHLAPPIHRTLHFFAAQSQNKDLNQIGDVYRGHHLLACSHHHQASIKDGCQFIQQTLLKSTSPILAVVQRVVVGRP